MQRRKFITLASGVAVAKAFSAICPPVAWGASATAPVGRSCSTHGPFSKETMEQEVAASNSGLTFLTPITFELVFTQRYGRRHTDQWTPDQIGRLTAAKAYVERVWSSREFRDRISSVHSWIWQDPKSITGTDLYERLTKNPKKRMKLSVKNNLDHYRWFGSELAVSSADGQTRLQKSYLDDPRTTLADLVNTLSHEYTHYSDSLESWDQGHSDELQEYVSYGTGCLAQNLAFPDDTCSYDPSVSTK